MELVIKIPENYYRAIKEIPVEQSTADMMIIKKSTPLPKGHGRLIDVDALYRELIFPNEQFGKAFKDILDDAQTIIEADNTESRGIER